MKEKSNKSLLVGWASRSITPDKPVLLAGQLYERISEYVRDPLTATALALETIDENGDNCDYSIIVSCDLSGIHAPLLEDVRDRVKDEIKDFDVKKIVIFATHTHTGPVYEKGGDKTKQDVIRYDAEGKDVITPADCQVFIADRIAEAIVEAWDKRTSGGVNRAIENAAIGFCRMAMYRDGSSRMYGNTNTADFKGLLSPSDPGIEMLFFKDEKQKVTGVIVNVSCPSQVVEHMHFISADFWSEARKQIRKNIGEDVFVLPITGAAGDQSPRDLTRLERESSPDTEAALNTYLNVADSSAAGWEMYDERGLFIIGDKIGIAVNDAYNSIKDKATEENIFKHEVMDIKLPMRRVSLEEFKASKRICEDILKRYDMDFNTENWYIKLPASAKEEIFISYAVVTRFKLQQEKDFFDVEVHGLRIGNSVLLTNPFELFIEYGMRIRSRCKAKQVLIAQLACGTLGYLPTEAAIASGGYSAVVASNRVGAEGGTLLVSHSVELANRLFED